MARAAAGDLKFAVHAAEVRLAARDFAAFYEQRERQPTGEDDVLVLSCDANGVVMRHEALGPATQRYALGAIPQPA